MSVVYSPAAAALDLSVLLGDWRNTNPQPGIARIVCEPASGGRLSVRCWGAADWGTVEAPVFAFTFESRDAGAFAAVFDLGFMEVRLQANVKLGVLVVATFNAFRDGSGRSNYFNREFFHRAPQ